jgi:hypothetical protein
LGNNNVLVLQCCAPPSVCPGPGQSSPNRKLFTRPFGVVASRIFSVFGHIVKTPSPPFLPGPFPFELVYAGCRLWVDLTHWYFGVYFEPYENVSNFWARHCKDWQQSALSAGRFWASSQGALPKASLASVLFASVALMSARTLPLAQRLHIIRWVNHLWMGCDFTGQAPTSQAGLAFTITSGTVDAKVSGQLRH